VIAFDPGLKLFEKENLFRYRAYFEGNLLRSVHARAHVRELMTRKSCAVGMRNAILRKNLNHSFERQTIDTKITFKSNDG